MNRGMTLLRSAILVLAICCTAAAVQSMRSPDPGAAPPRKEYDLELRYAMNLPLPVKSETPSVETSNHTEIPEQYLKPITENARKYGFTPALIAGIIARESNFDPKTVSPDGGRGLMQIMPEVCRERKCRDPFDPEENIRAGTAHLRALRDFFSSSPDPQERILFALAAYNGGAGHVIDARNIARRFKLDPDRWYGNVEEAIQFLKFRSFYKSSRHGYCNAGIVVDYVRSVKALEERFAQTKN